MRLHLKPVSDQTIVVTGATSGIGLATVRMAVAQGARVVMAARNAQALATLAEGFHHLGRSAVAVPADVANVQDVQRIRDAALEAFGGFDTWVNNAGVSIFGRYEDVPLQDMRRLFETNFWGVVHGSMIALEILRERGGALINLGSEVSDIALPLQGMYSASKHAVKGFTDSLRMEVEAAGYPVSVTLIKPAAIDTPFVPHAANYMDVQPRLPSPLYAPEVVADAILYAAHQPKRDIYVGGAAKAFSASNRMMPRVMDKVSERFMIDQQRSERPVAHPTQATLYHPGGGLREMRGDSRPVHHRSLYTRLTTSIGR
ncbi:SDR family oxidoreductase [Azoarcus olearius]|uniref:Short-chain dehydrogenase family protein n=1 Tax=Azoarcus sp. (strain BH72) TaxID=418699 RepID=A1K6A1_AZOSB|nr:SDR family oxidoreductase [Azoarcus olearius]ANQ84927.1 short chain dehydrogenase [Azoarcus olearius]CAL94356.1 Short-chain dehydrogenase family protein [Azoarcus olearius]